MFVVRDEAKQVAFIRATLFHYVPNYEPDTNFINAPTFSNT